MALYDRRFKIDLIKNGEVKNVFFCICAFSHTAPDAPKISWFNIE